MNYLIDTHVLIWYITDNENLPLKIKKLIEKDNSICYVSIASLWEIAIKYSIGRLDLKGEIGLIFQLIEESGFEILPISINHILRNSNLEFHHNDPFDRLLISQSIHEKLTLISKDQEFSKYNIPVFWIK